MGGTVRRLQLSPETRERASQNIASRVRSARLLPPLE